MNQEKWCECMWLNAVNCIPLTPLLYVGVTRPSQILEGIFVCQTRLGKVSLMIDDEVGVTPYRANLSSQYFETRQDRYVLFKDCKNLADFFSDVINTTLSHSFTLNTDGSTTPPSALTFDPLSSNRTAEAFKQSLGRAIKKLTVPSSSLPELTPEGDTIVCPLLQMGFCGVTQDQTVTLRLMETLRKDDTLYLASGYFNLPPVYSGSLLNSQGTCNVLAASAQASSYTVEPLYKGQVPFSSYTVEPLYKGQVGLSLGERPVVFSELTNVLALLWEVRFQLVLCSEVVLFQSVHYRRFHCIVFHFLRTTGKWFLWSQGCGRSRPCHVQSLRTAVPGGHCENRERGEGALLGVPAARMDLPWERGVVLPWGRGVAFSDICGFK